MYYIYYYLFFIKISKFLNWILLKIIKLTEVKDQTKYGVILSNQEGKIVQFIEKPKEFIGNKVNAGIYLFNTTILNKIPSNKPTSIERVIFPELVLENELYSVLLGGIWYDIATY